MIRLLALALLGALLACGYAARAEHAIDRFALRGANNILDEEHFGIVGGRLSAGIGYRTIGAVRGLWAPPFVSSDLQCDLTLFGQTVPTESYRWLPFSVHRRGRIHGIEVTTETLALEGARTLLMEITLRPAAERDPARQADGTAGTSDPDHVPDDASPLHVPINLRLHGTIDREAEWGFARPSSRTATVALPADDGIQLRGGEHALAARVCGARGAWNEGQWTGDATVPIHGTVRLYLVLSIGPTDQAAAECRRIAAAPARAVAETRRAWDRRAQEMFARVPRLDASDPRLVAWYNRSLVHFLTNRWDVPEFLLHPYYSTGSVKGGCVCNYLWNYGEAWEIFPLYDPAAARTHIAQFLKVDIGEHFAFDPIAGQAFGPWYPVNQEKIVGSIYHYVLNTGDTAFLQEPVAGRTVLDWVLHHATLRDDPSRPVELIDYGPSNSHLELRRGYPYNHVMPDLNGRRYAIYRWAADLADIAGKPAPWLRDRAEALKALLKRHLWSEKDRWFWFLRGDGAPDLRYTLQIYKLFGSGVLDAEEESGLLDHLNNREFLSVYGFHSLSKIDLAYDQVDIDNGGGGACTSFPPQIVEKLYRASHAAAADDILQRLLWWGDRLPYWGDSIVANAIDYRRDTPLQCTFDGVAGAQCLIFGLFGVRPAPDGSIEIAPHAPAFSSQLALKGLRLRGHVLDITVSGREVTVRDGRRTYRATVGTPIVVPPVATSVRKLRREKGEWPPPDP